MIVNGTVKPKEIVETFGVPIVTVKRCTGDPGAKGFYEPKPRHSSASVLKGEALERAQQLLYTRQRETAAGFIAVGPPEGPYSGIGLPESLSKIVLPAFGKRRKLGHATRLKLVSVGGAADPNPRGRIASDRHESPHSTPHQMVS